MRVFHEYEFDLKGKVLFRDTLPYIENWLTKNGFAYGGMSFTFEACDKGELLKKILSKYPQLEKYRRINAMGWEITPEGLRLGDELRPFEYYLSSESQNLQDNAKSLSKEDENIIREIASKIPRSFNPSEARIVLDNICWYHDINTKPAIGVQGGMPMLRTNNITLVKDFEMGNKHNILNVNIEHTKSTEELLDISAILTKLAEVFGEPCGDNIFVVFDEEETRTHDVANNELEPLLEALWAELQPEKAVPENALPAMLHFKAEDGQVVMIAAQSEKISPKKAILKAIKGTGYKHKFYPGGEYQCEKINQNNHLFRFSFSLNPGSSYMTFSMDIIGYNFKIDVPLADGVDVTRQSVVEETVQKIVNLALQVEKRLTEPLMQFYGKTPNWYSYFSNG